MLVGLEKRKAPHVASEAGLASREANFRHPRLLTSIKAARQDAEAWLTLEESWQRRASSVRADEAMLFATFGAGSTHIVQLGSITVEELLHKLAPMVRDDIAHHLSEGQCRKRHASSRHRDDSHASSNPRPGIRGRRWQRRRPFRRGAMTAIPDGSAFSRPRNYGQLTSNRSR